MQYQGCLSGVDEESSFLGQDTVVNYKECKGNKLIGNAAVCICLCVCEVRAFRSTYFM